MPAFPPHIPPLPQQRFYAPVATKGILRFMAVYAVVLLAGYVLACFSVSEPFNIFGLGVMFPGGGFLAHAGMGDGLGVLHGAMAAGSMLLFLFSVIGWLATGNVLLPPLVWLLCAVMAASMPHARPDFAVDTLCITGSNARIALANAMLVCIAGLMALCFAVKGFLRLGHLRRRKHLNTWLQAEAPLVAARFQGGCEPDGQELSPDDVKRMRFLLDRALQPVDEFAGFEKLDQFQTAAIRYQINFAGYALSMANNTYMPACRAYVHDAQQLLIAKLSRYPVWRYWTLENLWGNLRYNPNPVIRENIMFSGFAVLQMAMYHAATGAEDFNETGNFTLRHPSGQSWNYTLPELVDILVKMADGSPYHLTACEPNWIYPLCNTISAASVAAGNPDVWMRQQHRFREKLEQEFIDGLGRILPCRSRYTGFALPVFGGVVPQALPCFFLNAILPDVALRQWLLLRRSMIDGQRLNKRAFWPVDTGNYRFSRASSYAVTALSAAELGDEEIYQACMDALDAECPVRDDNVHFHRPNASVWAHAAEFLARSCRQNSFRHIIAGEHRNPVQYPHIAQAEYPAVLVARAVYRQGRFEAVLYNGGAAGRQCVTIGGLKSQTHYTCTGAEQHHIVADAQGFAHVMIMLDGRTEFKLYKTC